MQPAQVCKNITFVLLWKILLSSTSCTASHVLLINSPHYHHRYVLVYRKRNKDLMYNIRPTAVNGICSNQPWASMLHTHANKETKIILGEDWSTNKTRMFPPQLKTTCTEPDKPGHPAMQERGFFLLQGVPEDCEEYDLGLKCHNTIKVSQAKPHFHHLGWVAPDDMHMIVQKNNISQPGVKGWEGNGYRSVSYTNIKYKQIQLSHKQNVTFNIKLTSSMLLESLTVFL